MTRTKIISVLSGAVVLLLPVACGEGPLGPHRESLGVRVLGDTVTASLYDGGSARTAWFTTVVELTNRSRDAVVEYSLCGSILLRDIAREQTHGGVCPGIAAAPLVLEPGESTTIDFSHSICVAGGCMRRGETGEVGGSYEIRVHHRTVRKLPRSAESTLSREEVARSNVFEVVTAPLPGEASLLGLLFLPP